MASPHQQVKQLTILCGFVIVSAITAIAQPSLTLNVGPVSCSDGPDQYGLNATWPLASNPGDSQQITFYSGGTGLLTKLGLMWEVSNHFAAGLIYQNIQWTLTENQRKSDISSIGVEFRVNFSGSDKKIVPYFQGAYLFSNSNAVQQSQATGIGSQVQPSFSSAQSTSVGFGADLGIEFKITQSWGLQLTGGLHGIEAVSNDTFVKSLDYGVTVAKPQGFNGVFFIAFTGGVKYYFGRGVKKRDF